VAISAIGLRYQGLQRLLLFLLVGPGGLAVWRLKESRVAVRPLRFEIAATGDPLGTCLGLDQPASAGAKYRPGTE
jgi:hypothetical protein